MGERSSWSRGSLSRLFATGGYAALVFLFLLYMSAYGTSRPIGNQGLNDWGYFIAVELLMYCVISFFLALRVPVFKTDNSFTRIFLLYGLPASLTILSHALLDLCTYPGC